MFFLPVPSEIIQFDLRICFKSVAKNATNQYCQNRKTTTHVALLGWMKFRVPMPLQSSKTFQNLHVQIVALMFMPLKAENEDPKVKNIQFHLVQLIQFHRFRAEL